MSSCLLLSPLLLDLIGFLALLANTLTSLNIFPFLRGDPLSYNMLQWHLPCHWLCLHQVHARTIALISKGDVTLVAVQLPCVASCIARHMDEGHTKDRCSCSCNHTPHAVTGNCIRIAATPAR
jgi:hypothetical protein